MGLDVGGEGWCGWWAWVCWVVRLSVSVGENDKKKKTKNRKPKNKQKGQVEEDDSLPPSQRATRSSSQVTA